MPLEITKLGLQTCNLENKKPMYTHGIKTRSTKKKTKFAKTLKISKNNNYICKFIDEQGPICHWA